MEHGRYPDCIEGYTANNTASAPLVATKVESI